METNRREKKKRARERVEELKGFYIHLMVYVLVNLFIMGVSIYARMNEGDSFVSAFFSFGTFATPFFWGIGLAGHASKVLGFNFIFGKNWEERQIQKYMDADRKEVEKYKQLGDGYGNR
ncbi:MAG: 2TM domain-containing protein [Maribacter sp.]|uniref:2TM domain-containing protein n=1 Tax=Maribacter sp. 2307UL18-2 TaxID=3386274 RepID=UPI0039BD1336